MYIFFALYTYINALFDQYRFISNQNMATKELSKFDKLVIKAVIENTVDQLAIVGGTIQISLPTLAHPSSQVHQNATQRPLQELILKEQKQHLKVSLFSFSHLTQPSPDAPLAGQYGNWPGFK